MTPTEDLIICGLRLERTRGYIALYYNWLFILRAILYMAIIFTLQLVPFIQWLLLFIIQICFFVYTIICWPYFDGYINRFRSVLLEFWLFMIIFLYLFLRLDKTEIVEDMKKIILINFLKYNPYI